MAEEGGATHAAKRKAAVRLGLPETKHLPGNDEVDSAPEDLWLFHAASRRACAVCAGSPPAALSTIRAAPGVRLEHRPRPARSNCTTADSPEEIGFWLWNTAFLRAGSVCASAIATKPSRLTHHDGVAELCVFDRREARGESASLHRNR
jgi:hypothetical protein